MMIVASDSPNFLRSSWAAPLRSHLAFSDFIKLLKSMCSRFSHVLEQFVELPRSNAVSSNIEFSMWLRSQVKTFFKRFPAVTFMTRVGASLAKFSLLLEFSPSVWCLISKPASLNRFCCACKSLPLQGVVSDISPEIPFVHLVTFFQQAPGNLAVLALFSLVA